MVEESTNTEAESSPQNTEAESISVEPLFVERAAEKLGFERLAKAINKKFLAPYLLIVTILFFHIIVLSHIGKLWTGQLQYIQNPGVWVLVPGWLLAILVMRRVKYEYESMVGHLPDSTDSQLSTLENNRRRWYDRILDWLDVPEEPISKANMGAESINSNKILLVLLLGGWLFHFTWWTFDPGAGEVATELSGRPVALFQFFIIVPLVFYPLGAELVSLYIGIHVLLPFKIRRARLIDFTDPLSTGGLSHVGILLTKSTILFFVMVSLYAAFLTISKGTGIRRFQLVLIVVATVAGIILFYAPVYWLHIHLSNLKEKKLEKISESIQQKGKDNEMFPNTMPEPEGVVQDYTHDYIRLTRVEDTKEFPVNISMVQQVMFSVVLPYFSSLFFDTVLGFS